MNGAPSRTNGILRKKWLLIGEISHAPNSVNELKSLADMVEPKSSNPEDFSAEVESGAFEGCVAILRTFESVDVTGKFGKELIASLPTSVRFICHLGAGYDQIDVDACTEFGIQVSNVPNVVDDSTADATIFLIIGVLHNFNSAMFALRRGEWRGSPAPDRGHGLRNKVLGILGMGGIGQNLMHKIAGFGMRTQYHNRTKLSEELSAGAKYVSFDELLATSDVLSLNLPLNDDTKHIISGPEFDKMKKGIFIINTARGAIIDEKALVSALRSGKVRSCGLDVFESEPTVPQDLIDNYRLMLLPHLGTFTVETQEEMERLCLENVKLALTEGKLKSPVPEQKDVFSSP